MKSPLTKSGSKLVNRYKRKAIKLQKQLTFFTSNTPFLQLLWLLLEHSKRCSVSNPVWSIVCA